MAKKDSTTKTEEVKPKRKQLTPAERVAKAEAELAALRAKAEEKEAKVRTAAKEKRAKLVEKRDALNVQISDLDAIVGDVPAEAVPETEEV